MKLWSESELCVPCMDMFSLKCVFFFITVANQKQKTNLMSHYSKYSFFVFAYS